jgi:hypothetical protein
MMRRIILAAMLCGACASAQPASAQDFLSTLSPNVKFSFYGDFRIVAPSDQRSYLDGGLGKTHYGNDKKSGLGLHFHQGIVQASGYVIPELTFVVDGRVSPEYGLGADLIEAWLRYRPAPSGPFSWSVKAGAFFPPGSLENGEIGWTSFWTLTPSAINSWVGNEIRIIGSEATLKWQDDTGILTAKGAFFTNNDPAGVMIADHGWQFDDRLPGIFEKSRIPDAMTVSLRRPPPFQQFLFEETDGNIGWYADLTWEPAGIGGFEIMRYDNAADAAASHRGAFAWHTDYWSFSGQTQIGNVTLLAQGMTGDTIIRPTATFRNVTDYESAFVLAGYDMGDWWLAARAEFFQTRTRRNGAAPNAMSEDGVAGTFAASWKANDWLRLTGEVLVIDSNRAQRSVDGVLPHQTETQIQFAARTYL